MNPLFDPVFERPSRSADFDFVQRALEAELAYWRTRTSLAEVELSGLKSREQSVLVEMSQVRGYLERLRQETADYRRETDEERAIATSQIAALRRRLSEVGEEVHMTRSRVGQFEELWRRSRGENLWDRVQAAWQVLKGRFGAIPVTGAPVRSIERPEDLRKAA